MDVELFWDPQNLIKIMEDSQNLQKDPPNFLDFRGGLPTYGVKHILTVELLPCVIAAIWTNKSCII